MRREPLRVLLALFGVVFLAAPAARASLAPHYLERGRLRLSVDALGIAGTTGTIQVDKPAGGTVVAAFLYAASQANVMIADGDILLEGAPVAWADTVVTTELQFLLHNYVADVTDIVRPALAPRPGGRTDLRIDETTSGVDGTILAVVFEDPALPEGFTVALLFGAQNVAGDTFNIALADSIPDPLPPGYTLDLSLGISFSEGPGQVSDVDVNGSRMTSSAGGADDGGGGGALITAGGIEDTNVNPVDPGSATSADDELYDLKPFVASGQTSITVFTRNPSNNDNILFAGFYTSGDVTIGEGLTLRPTGAVKAVGSTHTIVGDMQTLIGSPIVGRRVDYSAFAGPHVGQVGASLVTDGNGQVALSYQGVSAGTDSIRATFTNSAGIDTTSNVVTVTWAQPVNLEISFSGTGAAPGIEDFAGYSLPVFSAPGGGGILITDLLGTLDSRDYRVGRWSPGTETYREGGANFSDLTVGSGYWVVTRDAAVVNLQGFVVPRSDFRISLESGPGNDPGWNQLGNPFGFAVDVADLRVTDGVDTLDIVDPMQSLAGRVVWEWTQAGGGTYEPRGEQDGLEPGGAFWLEKIGVGTIDLIVPAIPAALRTGASRESPVRWFVGVRACEGAHETEQVLLGAADLERAGWNPLSTSMPPLPGDRITLFVPKTDWGRLSGNYVRVFEPESPEMRWDLAVDGANAPGEVTLEFEARDLPAGTRLWLTDQETGATREIVAPAQVRFAATAGERRFTLMADLESARDHASGPSRVGFLQAYPNPFRSAVGFRLHLERETEVEVTIHDLAGRVVRSLERRGAAGEQVLVWDGKDERGSLVASGVYLARYRVGETVGSQRVVRVR